jgi:ribosomal protein S18 acetylase RimI-like enzyme
MNIHLKKVGSEDIPTLISIEQSVSGSKLYSPMLTNGEWSEALKKNITYLITEGDTIVGEVSYEMKDLSHAYIDGLAVSPAFQGRGIAREAMGMILDELKDVGQIDLVTHPENLKAIKLYESLGFKIESRIENYFGDGEPRVRMVLNKKP